MTQDLSLADRRILVTGASGYLGSALMQRLLKLGGRVLGISRSPPRDSTLEQNWCAVDLTSEVQVRQVFVDQRPEVVFHVAGVTNAARDPTQVLPTFDANAVATVILLRSALDHACDRFLYCASMEEPEGGATAVPTSPYAAAKWVASMYVRMFQNVFALPTIIVRPFFVYGPGHQPHDKLMPYVVRSFLSNDAPRLSSPNRQMDWVYLDDVVEGFVRAARSDNAVGQCVELGTGVLTSIGEVSEMIRSQLGIRLGALVQPNPMRAQESSRVANVDHCREVLSWSPETPLTLGLARTVDWYRRSR